MSNIVRSDSCKQKPYLYCRLCALLKPCRGLVNLQGNEKRRKYVMAQLARLNICVTNLDSEDDMLPKRVCSVCISSLERAYNFAMNVQKGQEVLNMHILAQNFRTEHDNSQSLKESSDLPSIVEKNGGILILSPSSIQAIVDRSSKSNDIYNNQSTTLRQNCHFFDKNVNEDKLVGSKNNSSTSLLPTTGSSNINELQKDTNCTDEIDMEINSDVQEFEEEYKVTVTEYQITKSKPGSNFTTECSNINKLDTQLPMDTTDEVQGEKIPGICFDFEEENIDENVENDDNCSDILRTKTNLTCNANGVNIEKVLINFKKQIEKDSELINNTNPQAVRIDLNASDSHKENAMEIAAEADSESAKQNVNQCENLEMQKMHTNDLIVKQEEVSSDDEVKYDELETLKQNVFNDYIRGTPVVVLNRTDADSGTSKTDLDNNIKHGPEQIFKSKKSHSQENIRNGFRKNDSSNDLVTSECMSWEQYRWKCASCDETFPHIDKLITHMKKQHGFCNFYQCTECNSQSHILDNFIKHLQHHDEQLKFSCFKCFKTYPNPYNVHLHYKMHAKSKITCLGCHETFSKREDLVRHCKKYKKKSVERNYSVKRYADGLTCKICCKKSTNLHTLLQHLEKSHSVQRKHYTCQKCGKIYYDSKSLMSHMKIHDVLYTSHCKFCVESFQNAHDLHSHIYGMHGEKPYTCDECRKTFRTTTDLQKHFLIHMRRKFTKITK